MLVVKLLPMKDAPVYKKIIAYGLLGRAGELKCVVDLLTVLEWFQIGGARETYQAWNLHALK